METISRRRLLPQAPSPRPQLLLPVSSFADPAPASAAEESPIRLGLASYTFRNFTRDQMIGFMKELRLTELNAKDAKDHLPMDPTAEAQAVADYTANGIHLHAAGAIYFREAAEDDIRSKFEYVKRAGIKVIVAGDPSPETLPRIEKFVKEYDIRLAIHNHGPEDKLWPSPLDILKDIKGMDARIGCCIDVGHTVRAGTDVIEAIHQVGRTTLQHAHEGSDRLPRQGQPGRSRRRQDAHPRHLRGRSSRTKYQGFVDLEYEVHGDDPMPGVSKSYAYMRGVLAGMGKTA